MARWLAIAAAALALVGAGCGDDEEEAEAPAETTPAAETAPPAETEVDTVEAPGGAVRIRMVDFAFDPEDVDVRVGQTITWVNEDDAPHNAVERAGDTLRTDTIEKGGEVTFTPEEAGTIDYICTIHPNMTGTLTVAE
jgi:plastocyanin